MDDVCLAQKCLDLVQGLDEKCFSKNEELALNVLGARTVGDLMKLDLSPENCADILSCMDEILLKGEEAAYVQGKLPLLCKKMQSKRRGNILI